MQAPEHALRTLAVVVLDEIYVQARQLVENVLVEALHEEPSVIAEDLGFEQHDFGDSQAGSIHQ
ncbi:hypothetical protein D3C72_2283520 [compost metagenome]